MLKFIYEIDPQDSYIELEMNKRVRENFFLHPFILFIKLKLCTSLNYFYQSINQSALVAKLHLGLVKTNKNSKINILKK